MTYKILHVVWLDSEAKNDWTPIEDISEELDFTHSVGMLIQETESFLTLALSVDPDTESANCFKKIPRSCIERVRVLCRISMTMKK